MTEKEIKEFDVPELPVKAKRKTNHKKQKIKVLEAELEQLKRKQLDFANYMNRLPQIGKNTLRALNNLNYNVSTRKKEILEEIDNINKGDKE